MISSPSPSLPCPCLYLLLSGSCYHPFDLHKTAPQLCLLGHTIGKHFQRKTHICEYIYCSLKVGMRYSILWGVNEAPPSWLKMLLYLVPSFREQQLYSCHGVWVRVWVFLAWSHPEAQGCEWSECLSGVGAGRHFRLSVESILRLRCHCLSYGCYGSLSPSLCSVNKGDSWRQFHQDTQPMEKLLSGALWKRSTDCYCCFCVCN